MVMLEYRYGCFIYYCANLRYPWYYCKCMFNAIQEKKKHLYCIATIKSILGTQFCFFGLMG